MDIKALFSCMRLRRLQTLCVGSDNGLPESGVPQGILVILGIDADHNPQAAQLFNYLIFDVFGSSMGRVDPAMFDDVVLFITASYVHIHASPEAMACLFPLIRFWPNLIIHCLCAEAASSTDDTEDFKVIDPLSCNVSPRTMMFFNLPLRSAPSWL